MPPSPAEPKQALARILGPSGHPIGVGCLTQNALVVTCAHVVRDALGLKQITGAVPKGRIKMDFPFLPGSRGRTTFPSFAAEVAPGGWGWMTTESPGDDIAVLQLIGEPPFACGWLFSPSDQMNKALQVFLQGFPTDAPLGAGPVFSVLMDHGGTVAGTRILDNDKSAYLVKPGFSGAPVFPRDGGQAAGMLIGEPVFRKGGVLREADRVAYVIPSSRVYEQIAAVLAASGGVIDGRLSDSFPQSDRPEPVERQTSGLHAAKRISWRTRAIGGGVIILLAGALVPWTWKTATELYTNNRATTETSPEGPPANQPVARESIPLSPVELAALRPGESFQECDVCPKMVVVPRGKFIMGSSETEEGHQSDESPFHEVSITRLFSAGKSHVTRREFAKFVDATNHKMEGGCRAWGTKGLKLEPDYSWLSPGFTQDDNHPVVCVNWEDAEAYIKWLSSTTGASYRLLSEAEVEYVARGTSSPEVRSSYFFGNDAGNICKYGNGADASFKTTFADWTTAPCNDGYVFTAPIAHFAPNGFGLHDTHGNVWSWTKDCWADNYNATPRDGSPNLTGSCTHRVLRGGAWGNVPSDLRAAIRIKFPPEGRVNIIGFRVLREI